MISDTPTTPGDPAIRYRSVNSNSKQLYYERSTPMYIQHRLLAPRRVAAGILLACALLRALAPSGGQAAGPHPPLPAPPTPPCPQFGVNLSGGEFGDTLPGTYGLDYIYPGINNNAWELDYFHSKGLNLIRLNVRWERLQHALYGALTTFDIGLIDQVLTNAAARGMSVIITPHSYAHRHVGNTDY